MEKEFLGAKSSSRSFAWGRFKSLGHFPLKWAGFVGMSGPDTLPIRIIPACTSQSGRKGLTQSSAPGLTAILALMVLTQLFAWRNKAKYASASDLLPLRAALVLRQIQSAPIASFPRAKPSV